MMNRRALLTFLGLALMLTAVPRLALTAAPVRGISKTPAKDGTWTVVTTDGKTYQGCALPVFGLRALCFEE